MLTLFVFKYSQEIESTFIELFCFDSHVELLIATTFQETKINSFNWLEENLIHVNGYESFWAFPKQRKVGYFLEKNSSEHTKIPK